MVNDAVYFHQLHSNVRITFLVKCEPWTKILYRVFVSSLVNSHPPVQRSMQININITGGVGIH